MGWQVSNSLAERFAYEGRIGGFGFFAVIGAAYFDESGDEHPRGRIGIAGAVGSTSQWLDFETEWSKILVTPGDFHAVETSASQRALSEACARLAKKLAIGTLCITVRQDGWLRTAQPIGGFIGQFMLPTWLLTKSSPVDIRASHSRYWASW